MIKTIPIAKLQVNKGQIDGLPKNPRFIRDERFAKLKKSIQDLPSMLELRELIVYPQNGHYVTIGGNMRLRAAKDIGLKEMPCKVLDKDTPPEVLAEISIKDNVPFGETDVDILANEWTDFPLDDWGMELPEFEPIDDEMADAEPQIDKAAELNKKWKVKTGDLWQIGDHRLICGDSTSPQAVERVLGGSKPNLMVTDPPYGVELDTEWREDAGISAMGEQSAKGLEWDTNADWTPALSLVNVDIAYVWHANRYVITCAEALKAAGFEIKQQIIWNKSVAPFGRAHYHWKHEPCWYAVKKGKTANWQVGADQVTVWDDASPRHIMGGSTEEKTPHPTQKPIGIFQRPIENHTREGDGVYDPFAGSGTTLVACENLNRKCYAIEISPAYCSVILERMQTAFPDIEIKRIENGKGKGKAKIQTG